MERDTLLRWRYRRGLTQAQLAEKAGVTQNTVSRVELEKMVPSPATLVKLARALDIDPVQILLDIEGRRRRGRPRKIQPDETEERERAAA